ncbi:MAG: tetratricopeptide repeat protein [Pirellulaceae bacterium]|nr:tetratricopeptide repeat protein [Pirellulaceae bacterium]
MLLAVAIYFPALRGEFIWDDVKIYIVENELMNDPYGIFKFWFSSEPVDYFPLTYTSFWIEWQMVEADPLLYHLTNLVLHAVTSFVIYLLLVELKVPWALWLALLFLVHPIQVESVAWVSQRKTVLSVMLGVLACYYYTRQRTVASIKLQIAAWLCFALSIAAKPTLITLPVAFAVVEILAARTSLRALVRMLWPYFLIAAVLGAVGVLYQQKLINFVDVRQQTLAERLLTMSWVCLFYVRQIFAVWTLNFVYPRWDVSLASPVDWLPTLVMFTTSFGLWRYRKICGVEPLSAWCVAWITLFPSLGLVDVFYWRYSYVGDHYIYQSLPVLFALFAYLLHRPVSQLLGLWPRRGLAVGLAVILGIVSFFRAELYESPERLWQATVRVNPSAGVAWWNLGALEQSSRLLLKAVEVQPELFEVWLQLAQLALTQRDDPAALQYFLQGELAAPAKLSEHLSCLIGQVAVHTRFKDFESARKVLGNIDRRIGLGELIDPTPSWQQLSLDVVRVCLSSSEQEAQPNEAESFQQLLQSQREEANLTTIARISEDCGALDFAIAAHKSRLNRDPQHVASLAAIGRCYIELQRFDEAEEYLRGAVAAGDLTPETKISLGVALMNLGRPAEGLQVFEAAARNNRLYFRLWSNLGLAYVVNGKPREAYVAWKTALELNPDDVALLRDLSWLASTNEELAAQPAMLRTAISNATRAWELSGRARADCLDALAAAQASSGKFRDAELTMRSAIRLSESLSGASNQLQAYQYRLSLYQAGKMYRE